MVALEFFRQPIVYILIIILIFMLLITIGYVEAIKRAKKKKSA